MKRLWTENDLAEQWTLHPDELALLANKTGHTRLGFAVLLRYFQQEGRFPQAKSDVPGAVIAYIARQVGVEPAEYLRYDWRGRSIEYHRAQIRAFLGFREATARDAENLALWLVEHVLSQDHQAEHLRTAVYEHCRCLRIEPPSPGRVDRLIGSALHTFESLLGTDVTERLGTRTLARLDKLVGSGEGESESRDSVHHDLQWLKADPGRAGLESVIEELDKLRYIRELGLPDDLFGGISSKVIGVYRQRAATEKPGELRAQAEPVRAVLLAALCRLRAQEITDGLVELLIQIVHRIGAKAERRVEKELLDDFRRVSGKTGLLFRIAEASIEHPDGTIREVLYPVVGGEQTLRDLVREQKSTGPSYRTRMQVHLRASYQSHYRRMVPHVLEALRFRSNNAAHRPVVEAIALLERYADSQARLYAEDEDVPIEGVVPPGWRDLVVSRDARGCERVDRINYEICVLQALREGLRSKEIWVKGATRYRNPDDDLPTDFQGRREEYYEVLRQPMEADAFVDGVRDAMQAALGKLDEAIPRSSTVRLLAKANGWISVSPLDAQSKPLNLAHLKSEVAARWPMTNLLDILKEVELRTGFTELLTTTASREALARDVL